VEVRDPMTQEEPPQAIFDGGVIKAMGAAVVEYDPEDTLVPDNQRKLGGRSLFSEARPGNLNSDPGELPRSLSASSVLRYFVPEGVKDGISYFELVPAFHGALVYMVEEGAPAGVIAGALLAASEGSGPDADLAKKQLNILEDGSAGRLTL
jgi:hypothetical protein